MKKAYYSVVYYVGWFYWSLSYKSMIKRKTKNELRQRHDQFISFAKYLAFGDPYDSCVKLLAEPIRREFNALVWAKGHGIRYCCDRVRLRLAITPPGFPEQPAGSTMKRIKWILLKTVSALRLITLFLGMVLWRYIKSWQWNKYHYEIKSVAGLRIA